MSDYFLIPPQFLLILGAVFIGLVPQFLRSAFFVLITLLTFLIVLFLPQGQEFVLQTPFAPLHILQINRLNFFFGVAFAAILFLNSIFSFHVKDTLQQVAGLLYGAAALGVTFAGDYLTLFIFWEVMAISSTIFVWAQKTETSYKAGMRYLIMHILGGSFLFAGIILSAVQTGNLMIHSFADSPKNLSVWLIFIGVALNAAIPPLHAWVYDAYPKATPTGTVFMSALTTKVAVYVLLCLFPGWHVLIYLGIVMALYGAVYAALANDMRAILACHIVSQVGFMVVGIGLGSDLALNGAALHAVNNILYKSLLFMGVVSVIHLTGKHCLSELGGLYPHAKIIFWLFFVGSFAISGFPLFNGFISKNMIIKSAGAAHAEVIVLLLKVASLGTLYSTFLKIPYFCWFAQNKKYAKLQPVSWNMVAPMSILAVLCVALGVLPNLLSDYMPYPQTVVFSAYKLQTILQTLSLLCFAILAFWLLRHRLKPKDYILCDIDFLYLKLKVSLVFVFIKIPESLFTATATVFEKISLSLVRGVHLPHNEKTRVNFSMTEFALACLFVVFLIFFLMSLL